MNVVAINGGPRKNYNTATLLQHAVNGAKSAGADAEVFHLYDYDCKGCVSCFACKRRDNPNPGRCAMRDAITPVLEAALRCDVLLLGSPVYLGEVTGVMRCFMERLLFPVISYEKTRRPIFPGHISTAFFFTMNMPKENAAELQWMYRGNTEIFRWLGGTAEYLASYDTWQFDDYSKYAAKMFDLERKAKVKTEQFPLDCREAFGIGARLAGEKP